jgi:arylsulfatase A-like enzyme
MIFMQAVILSFDSLTANSLGCYGNDWIETPNWDRLAACGVVFNRYFADTTGQIAGMAWANGQHSLAPLPPVTRVSLGSRLRSLGVATKLIATNQQQIWQKAVEPDVFLTVEGREGSDVQPHEVPIAQLVKAGLSAWNEPAFQGQPRLLWLHAPAPGTPPQGFESLYFDDFEERGEQISELTDEQLANHPAVYAGSVSLIDYWLGEWLNGLESQTQNEPTLLIIMAAKGYPWHRILPSKSSESPSVQSPLNDQCIRAPLVLKVSGDDRFKEFTCVRSDRLVQTCDLVPTLLDWFGTKSTGDDFVFAGQSWLKEMTEAVPARAFLRIGDGGCFEAIRTAEWLSVRDKSVVANSNIPAKTPIPSAWLFVKPEDIWDVNNVAAQHADRIQELWSHIASEAPFD